MIDEIIPVNDACRGILKLLYSTVWLNYTSTRIPSSIHTNFDNAIEKFGYYSFIVRFRSIKKVKEESMAFD